MPSNIGKQILEDIMELIDDEMFWAWFEPSDFYSRFESAFRDEGDDCNCNLCDYEIEGDYGHSTETSDEDLMKEHIIEEHSEEIINKAIQSHFQKPSKAKKISALEDPIGKKEAGF